MYLHRQILFFIFEVRSLYILKTAAYFDSAHFLYGYDGKCSNIHGHRWKTEAEFSGRELQKSGIQREMLIDFGDIKRELKALADSFDHSLIYEKGSLKDKTLEALKEEGFKLTEIPCRPTAENLARIFFEALKEKNLPVSAVTVYETPENCAVYMEEKYV